MENRFKKVDWSVITPSDWKTLTYVEIARKAGCSYSQVKDYFRQRMRSGRAPARPSGSNRPRRSAKFDWSKITPRDWREMIDGEIARKVGCSAPTVSTRRRWLIGQDRKAGRTGERFACANARSRPAIDWKPVTPGDWRAMVDREIAKKAGCSVPTARTRRRWLIDQERKAGRTGERFACANARSMRTIDWKPVTPGDWRAMVNREIAKKVGCSTTTVHKHRRRLIDQERKAGRTGERFVCANSRAGRLIDWSPITLEDWRNMSDYEISRKLRCSSGSVILRRRRLKKTPSGKQRYTYLKPARPPGSRHDWEKIERADWKALNDVQIARKVGCSLHTAGHRRKWLIVTAAEAGEKGSAFICEQPQRAKKPAPDWSLLTPQDWEMHNIQIARKLGCPAYRVSHQRKKMIAEEKRNRRKNRQTR